MLIDILKPDFEFQDVRGTLTQIVRTGYNQVNVITSVADSVRGGHYHKENMEAFYIIEGAMELDVWLPGEEEKERYTFAAGDMFVIPLGVIHSFNFLNATTLVSMYSKGVEYPDGSKDIIAVNEGEGINTCVKQETFETMASDVEKNITTLQRKNEAGSYEIVCQKEVLLEKEQKFKISFAEKFPADCKLRWYVLRSKKIKLYIERISYVTNGKIYEASLSDLYYHEGEMLENGWVDMLTLDPCVDFCSINQTIDELIIQGKWIVNATEKELTDVYYKKLERVSQQYDMELGELKEEVHRLENELKTINKKNEKNEIYIELLKQDVSLRDVLVEKYIGK